MLYVCLTKVLTRDCLSLLYSTVQCTVYSSQGTVYIVLCRAFREQFSPILCSIHHVRLSVCLSVCLSVHLSVCMCHHKTPTSRGKKKWLVSDVTIFKKICFYICLFDFSFLSTKIAVNQSKYTHKVRAQTFFLVKFFYGKSLIQNLYSFGIGASIRVGREIWCLPCVWIQRSQCKVNSVQ